jgi:hypothetical protein
MQERERINGLFSGTLSHGGQAKKTRTPLLAGRKRRRGQRKSEACGLKLELEGV